MSVGSIQSSDNSGTQLKIDLASVEYEHAMIEENGEEEEENDQETGELKFNDIEEEEEEGYDKDRPPKISDFKPIKVLGQGAYGKVVLVQNKNTGLLFAQKELKKASIIVDGKTAERTKSERDILASVTEHQNIVKLFYALHDSRKLYLILEYIPGGELFQYLAKEKFLSERSASFYVAQMALALKHLHGLGIVYRDLKPENCLLDKDGYLVLTDFGLAKQSTTQDSENWCNSIIGTPEYCSPEVLRGEDYGTKTDWWSLGCVMYDMLTGAPPFTGNNHKDIIDKILKKKPKYPNYITSDAKGLLNKLINKNVNKRFDVDNQWQNY
ncbi:unnamed protein product [Ambrosiozyma monospora]|uniref:Unnamed protein product n=1 Tax=Ambrosiozyma monospora TaxID=43982 RepID=A0ACB5TH05_AMBMO|nr:unnamed protein product [Ambrosiozyma monospora]